MDHTYRVSYSHNGASHVRHVAADSALHAYRLTEAIPGAYGVAEPEIDDRCEWPARLGAHEKCNRPAKGHATSGNFSRHVCGTHANRAEAIGWTVVRGGV